MKKNLISLLLACLAALPMRADGGMWFLQLMEKQHLLDSLRAAGLQMKPDELLALRDCVGQFGGGCTAEVISPDGLILTNNHCGYGFVHAMSTLEKNYLQDGYFAKSRAEELPVPELTFTFVLEVRDVTEQILQRAKADSVDIYTMMSRPYLRKAAKEQLGMKDYPAAMDVEVEILPFYGGNSFYAIATQTFRDVRLVVNPPLNVAQFGGDGDNWVWPRHNPDFAVFRVYADKAGLPADYAETNVPLHRDRYLPISLQGYKEGEYTMIMGFPGRTKRYLSAIQLEGEMTATYEPIALAGTPVLEWERIQMEKNDSMRLALQDDHMMLQNMVKNFGGATEAVRKARLVEQKRAIDEQLTLYGRQKGDRELAEVVERLNTLIGSAIDTLRDAALVSLVSRMDDERKAVVRPLWDDICHLELSKGLLDADSATLAAVLPAYRSCVRRVNREEAPLARTYQRGLLEMNGWSTAPDANFTQRFTYGHVKGYSPRDAVLYDYKTLLGGMFEKESQTDPDYAVNPRMRQLYEARDFGRYANKRGELQTDFLTDNDITGGNSGSPVLNARGELIGVAFDGNIESLSSDFKYNPDLQRCINADIRYVLWTIDIFGGSKYLLDELDLRP